MRNACLQHFFHDSAQTFARKREGSHRNDVVDAFQSSPPSPTLPYDGNSGCQINSEFQGVKLAY